MSRRKSFPIGHVLDDGGIVREQIKAYDAFDNGLCELWIRVEYPLSERWFIYMVWTGDFSMSYLSLDDLEDTTREAGLSFFYYDEDGGRIDVYVE